MLSRCELHQAPISAANRMNGIGVAYQQGAVIKKHRVAYPISKPKSSRCALCSRRQLLLKLGHLLVGPLGESTMWKPLLPTLGKPLLIFAVSAASMTPAAAPTICAGSG